MQMTTEARAWLDATVRRILARHTLGDPERAGITYELMSHLHAAGEARATAAGRAEVTREDLAAVLAEAGGEEALAAAFVQPLAKPLVRVDLWPRLAAFAVDAVILGIVLTFVHGILEYLLRAVLPASTGVVDLQDLGFLLPWAFHDPSLHPVGQVLIGAASVAIVLGYFAWFEAREGRTLGKRALGLRVVRADGAPLQPRDALVRNVAKLSPLLLVIDTLALAFGDRHAAQRLSDRIAGTIVVRA